MKKLICLTFVVVVADGSLFALLVDWQVGRVWGGQ